MLFPGTLLPIGTYKHKHVLIRNKSVKVFWCINNLVPLWRDPIVLSPCCRLYCTASKDVRHKELEEFNNLLCTRLCFSPTVKCYYLSSNYFTPITLWV